MDLFVIGRFYQKSVIFGHKVQLKYIACLAIFQIHFKDKGPNGRTRKHNNMFTYDWRMWSIQELRELMQETGFRKTHVYWEGTTRNGEGDGIFSRVEVGEECEAWASEQVTEYLREIS